MVTLMPRSNKVLDLNLHQRRYVRSLVFPPCRRFSQCTQVSSHHTKYLCWGHWKLRVSLWCECMAACWPHDGLAAHPGRTPPPADDI